MLFYFRHLTFPTFYILPKMYALFVTAHLLEVQLSIYSALVFLFTVIEIWNKVHISENKQAQDLLTLELGGVLFYMSVEH